MPERYKGKLSGTEIDAAFWDGGLNDAKTMKILDWFMDEKASGGVSFGKIAGEHTLVIIVDGLDNIKVAPDSWVVLDEGNWDAIPSEEFENLYEEV